MTEHDDRTLPPHCPRRTVLQGVLVLGAAGLLAACGGSNDTAQQPAAPAGGADTGGAPSTPTQSSAPSAAASEPAGGGGSALGPASEIPVGGGKIYEGPKIVVTQPSMGTYKAFSAVCTHEQCTVSDVSDGTINCPCHGSKFNITDGSVAHGPAESPLPEKKVMVAGGNVSVT
jgi:Rieske Fe-S protein